MKRNCNRCRALSKSVSGVGCKCSLGYKIECIEEIYKIHASYKPLEECPKPMTYIKLCEIGLERSRKH